jgi:hypothetical protein
LPQFKQIRKSRKQTKIRDAFVDLLRILYTRDLLNRKTRFLRV